MSTIFEDFRKGEEEQVPSTSHTSEEHIYIITKPANDGEITIHHSIQDQAQEEGYTKRTKTVILETGCCGMLTSLSSDTRYKPPAGRCQNPECKVLLCQKHVEERQSCIICGRTLCPACLRQTNKKTNLIFCKQHFEEFAEEECREELVKCLTGKQNYRQE